MNHWTDRQNESREDAPRGPRAGFTEPVEQRRRRVVVMQDTFLTFRPWSSCGRCVRAVQADESILPVDSDYVCPHTRHREYLDLLNRLRNAGPHGPVSLGSREFSNERGEMYASITWEEPEDAPNEAAPRHRAVPRL